MKKNKRSQDNQTLMPNQPSRWDKAGNIAKKVGDIGCATMIPLCNSGVIGESACKGILTGCGIYSAIRNPNANYQQPQQYQGNNLQQQQYLQYQQNPPSQGNWNDSRQMQQWNDPRQQQLMDKQIPLSQRNSKKKKKKKKSKIPQQPELDLGVMSELGQYNI